MNQQGSNGNGQRSGQRPGGPGAPGGAQGRPAIGPMGRGPMMMGTQKARDFNGTMRKLIEYLGSYKLALGIAIVFAVLSTIFAVVGPKILGLATTKLFAGVVGQITGNGTSIDFEYI